jgi:adenylate kinase
MIRILLIGPNGSGKSTQAKLLGEYLTLPVIETGEMLREIASEDSALGREVNNLLLSGNLVSDELILEIISQRLKKDDALKGFVATGFPRNLKQVEDLNISFEKVFYLEIADIKVIERLMKRGRNDDTRLAIEQRLKVYHEQTEPLLEYFEKKGVLERVGAEGSVEAIQEDLRKRLNG